MRLLIISDTSMYQVSDNSGLEVFEPTLREIEAISVLFSKVTWFGYTKGDDRPGHARPPFSSKIELMSFPTTRGGTSVFSKLKIIPVLPKLSWIIFKAIRENDIIHSRGPSVPAFLSMLFSWVFRKKIFWHKYAGNWIEASPPFMYAVQKWLLTRLKHTVVTVNGEWPGQPKHIHSFENPCFTDEEWAQAAPLGKRKEFNGRLVLCFSGLVAASKGVPQLISALRDIPNLEKYLSKIVIAGDGPELNQIKLQVKHLGVPVEILGYVDRSRLNHVYEHSHILVLPSRTEGFPKVVAEGASFGCIPVVTDVSSIGQYVIDGKSGFLLANNSPQAIREVLVKVFNHSDLKAISSEAMHMSESFTYSRFADRISRIVLDTKQS